MARLRYLRALVAFWVYARGIRTYCWQCDDAVWGWHKHAHRYFGSVEEFMDWLEREARM